MSSSLSILPNIARWPVSELSAVTSMIRRGTTPVYVDSSDVHAIGQRCVTRSDFDASASRPHSSRAVSGVVQPCANDVLVNSTGTGTIGRSVVFPHTEQQFIVDGHVTIVRHQPSRSVGAWINEVLRSPWGQAHLETHCYAGSTNQIELSSSALASTRVAVPHYAEQCRIVEIVEAFDNQIRATEQIIAKLKLTKLGVAHDLLDTRNWDLTNLGAVAKVKNGTTPSRAVKAYWENGTVPWLASGKVNDYIVTSGSELITEKAVSDCNLQILPPNSVIIGMIGEGKTRGMSARTRIHAAINQNIAGVIPGDSLDDGFLHHYLVHSYTRIRSGGRGSNQDALNTRLVSELEVPVPEIDEQREIKSTLDAFDFRLEQEEMRVRKLDVLKKGLISDLLTGRVRVPAEPRS